MGKFNDRIIRSFKQTTAGNCVSIAVIKAGIEVFGVNGLFQHRKKENEHQIIMIDGKELTLSDEEIELAENSSGFQCLEDREIFDYAQLCYAIMAKRAQRDGNDGFMPGEMSYARALTSLNNGEHYMEGPSWLGLQSHTVRIGKRYRWQHTGCIANSPQHCFYMSYGYEDDYGAPDRSGGIWNRMRVRNVVKIVKQPTYLLN